MKLMRNEHVKVFAYSNDLTSAIRIHPFRLRFNKLLFTSRLKISILMPQIGCFLSTRLLIRHCSTCVGANMVKRQVEGRFTARIKLNLSNYS